VIAVLIFKGSHSYFYESLLLLLLLLIILYYRANYPLL
jgi:hypothetical protein